MTRRPENRQFRRLAGMTVYLMLAISCTSEPVREPEGAQTIADLSAVQDTATGMEYTGDEREKAIMAYRTFLQRYPDSPSHGKVTRRLADLLVESAADLQAVTPGEGGRHSPAAPVALQRYREAIAIYEKLLREEGGGDQGELLYQLARAYEENGQAEEAIDILDRLIDRYPDMDARLYADSRFRRGELQFQERRYADASVSYEAVVRLGESVPVYEQALHKLGWSLFRQERYEEALERFFTLLDRKIPNGSDLDTSLSALSRAEREQVDDTFRAINLSFSYLNGVDSARKMLSRYRSRPYERRIYRNLAEFYEKEELYSDAAATRLALVQLDPFNPESARIDAAIIRIYQEAGFQHRVAEAKAGFADRYGRDSVFWQHNSPDEFAAVIDQVKVHIIDLARHYHASAQASHSADSYRKAEHYYRVFLDEYPGDERVAEMNFLLAELLYEARQYPEAVREYERTAFTQGDPDWATRAGEGALRAYEAHKNDLGTVERERWSNREIESAIRFIEAYPGHPGAAAALVQSGAAYLEQDRPREAIRVSETVIQNQASLPATVESTAWSVMAQAHFALGQYPSAEQAYRQALRLNPQNKSIQKTLNEGLAAAIYKQAEQYRKQDDVQKAAELYTRSESVAPASSIAPKARYDAAAALMQLAKWKSATESLEQFRADYPGHSLQAEVERKLAYSYMQQGRNRDAARVYLRIGREETDQSLGREALVRAADLFERDDSYQDAIDALELCIRKYRIPSTEKIDLLQRLADLEKLSGDISRQEYWLKEVIEADRNSGNARTVHTRTLAGKATMVLAGERLAAFRQIPLVEPLEASLARKLQEMRLALDVLEEAIDYGITPVMTEATYQIARMYDDLGIAILASERPADLGQDEILEYDRLLKEQAESFEQKAIDVYETNIRRSRDGMSDTWIDRSRERLAELRPLQYTNSSGHQGGNGAFRPAENGR